MASRRPAVRAAVFALLLAGCASAGRVTVRRGRPLPPPPGALPPGPSEVLPQTVRVAPGDSLWRLSRRWLGTGFRWREMARANALRRPWRLEVGQVLVVPPLAPPVPTPRRRRPKAAPDAGGPREEDARRGWTEVPNDAYTVGERLTFAVQYGPVTAGYATLSVPETQTRCGRLVFHVVAQAKSLPFFDSFFTVRDRLDSYIDAYTGFSWGYEKHIREGRFAADAEYVYNQRDGRIEEPAKGTSAPLPTAAQDVLSCFYYFRTQPLRVGDRMSIPVTADNMKSYDLSVDVLREETVRTLAGDFHCVVVEPHLAFRGVFRQEGQVLLWITDDARRLPVRIQSSIAIGHINITLQNAQWVQPVEETQP